MNTHIPGWISCRLSDIYTERKEPGNESLPLLTVSIHSGVSDGELDEDELPKKVKRIEDKSQYKRAATGDLVFNMMRAWQGAIGTVRTEGMVSPAYIVAKPNGKVYPPFMDYYMKAPRMVGMINRQSYGVTDFRKRLYWDSFAPIPCVLPPVREQRKIAEILSTQDKVIELQGRKIEELKRFKKGCLEKMFPRKGQKVPEKRFPGFTDDWERRKVGDITIESTEYLTLDSGLPLFTSSRNGLLYQNEYRGNVTTNNKQTLFSVVPLGACTYRHMSDDDVFHLNINTIEKGLVSREYPVFCGTPNHDIVFIVQHINSSKAFRAFCAEQKMGGTRTRLYYKALCEFTMMVPSFAEQRRISKFLLTIDHLITLHQRKLDEMKKQKKALMQLLLTGIVRV